MKGNPFPQFLFFFSDPAIDGNVTDFMGALKKMIEFTIIFFKVSGCNQFILATFK